MSQARMPAALPVADVEPISWLPIALAVGAVAWGANQFAPMLLVYRETLGLSSAVAQATFGCYALGLVPGLLIGGPLSDRCGRKPILLGALVASVAASGVLLGAGGHVGLLFTGRGVAGLASGAAFSAGAAWIKELSDAQGARRATVAMTAGFALGPLAAGLLAQWAPDATVVPYLPHVALTVAALLALSAAPASLGHRSARTARASGSPWQDRRFRLIVAPLAPWVFGAAAIPLAFLPGLVSEAVGDNALLFGALVACGTALAGIAVQGPAAHLDRLALIVTALASVTAGMVLAALAAQALSPALIALAAVVLGAAYGLCQVSGLGEVQRLATADRLAATTAAYQCLSYTGFALPFLLAAVASTIAPATGLLILAALSATTLVLVARSCTRLP